MSSDLLNEAVDYFKSQPGFSKLFNGVAKRYYSLGRLGGSVVMDDLTEEERLSLRGFFYKDIPESGSVRISIRQIEKVLEASRFESLDLKEIIEAYLGEPLVWRQDELRQAKIERKNDLNNWLTDLKEGFGRDWLIAEYHKKEDFYQFLKRKHISDSSNCQAYLIVLSKQLDYLLDESFRGMNLSVFGAETASDPHYLDKGSEGETWLTTALAIKTGVKYPSNVEEFNQLYQSFGLDRDNLLNNSLVYGLKANHPAFSAYNAEDTPHIVTLQTLEGLGRIKAAGNRVYVFENPSVFQAVCASFSANKVTCICSRGQLNTATLLLLDKVSSNVDLIYYSGDFDPEGLLIAQRLIDRYPDKLRPWRMSVSDYKATNAKVKLSKSRLNKLSGVKDERLTKLAQQMQVSAKAGYQEMLIDKYINDIKNDLS